MTTTRYRAAAVQAAPVYLDPAATAAKAIQLMEQAAREGAAIITFGEAWLPGYPFWVWLDGAFRNMGRFKQYRDACVEIDGPELRAIRAAAGRLGIAVVMGLGERSGGSLYLSQAAIGRKGELLFHRRKLRPTMAERMIYGEGHGSDLHVQETELGRLGALCCWEHLNPLAKYAMYARHEQVHVAAWPSFGLDTSLAYALGSDVNNALSRVYAVEGQCYVLAPTSIIDAATLAAIADRDGSTAPFRAGGGFTMIYGPDGRALCEPVPEDREAVLYADIDLAAIDFAKVAADPVGHYSRPDVLRLWFNDAPAPCVESGAPPLALDDGGDAAPEG